MKKYTFLSEKELGLVIGCKAILVKNGELYHKKAYTLNATSIHNMKLQNEHYKGESEFGLIPLLKPMMSMTEDEKDEFREQKFDKYPTENLLNQIQSGRMLNWHIGLRSVKMVKWLLEKHFDVFGWIPEGKALDAAKWNDELSIYQE